MQFESQHKAHDFPMHFMMIPGITMIIGSGKLMLLLMLQLSFQTPLHALGDVAKKGDQHMKVYGAMLFY